MPKKNTKEVVSDTEKDQWIVALPDCLAESSNNDTNPIFCKLKHPKSGDKCIFLLSGDNKKIFEVTQYREKFRSWFIGETVMSDGSLSIPTPVDVVYLILPYLIKAADSGKFMQLEQILEDSDYPENNRLCSCDGVQHLDRVCDTKGTDDCHVYRYSKEKTLSWLKAKVERICAVSKEKNICTSSTGSSCTTYVNTTAISDDEVLRFAHGMISEYLPKSLSEDLHEHLGIKDAPIVHEKPAIEEPKAKRNKKNVAPTEDYSKQNGESNNNSKKNAPLTSSQKKLEKVDKKGMKNIASFFSPKPKK